MLSEDTCSAPQPRRHSGENMCIKRRSIEKDMKSFFGFRVDKQHGFIYEEKKDDGI